jgi:hypothetical protein
MVLSLLVVWIAIGTEMTCYDLWIPLPFVGYLCFDVTVLGFLLVELPLLWWFYPHPPLLGFVLAFLVSLPFLPDSIRPTYNRTSTEYIFELLQREGFNPFGKTIRVLDQGLTPHDAERFARLEYDHRANWTHASSSMPLGTRSVNYVVDFPGFCSWSIESQ